MSVTSISTDLLQPITDLLEAQGALVTRDCEVAIVSLETEDSVRCYEEFLQKPSSGDVDPLVAVTFGPPLNPYIGAPVQVEVWTIVATYQSLGATAFAPSARPIALAAPVSVLPFGSFFQYHSNQIALHAVMARIENPADPVGLPLLTSMNSGDTICDINLTYGNCVVTRKIRKN